MHDYVDQNTDHITEHHSLHRSMFEHAIKLAITKDTARVDEAQDANVALVSELELASTDREGRIQANTALSLGFSTECKTLLMDLENWDFDVFKLAELSNNEPLVFPSNCLPHFLPQRSLNTEIARSVAPCNYYMSRHSAELELNSHFNVYFDREPYFMAWCRIIISSRPAPSISTNLRRSSKQSKVDMQKTPIIREHMQLTLSRVYVSH